MNESTTGLPERDYYVWPLIGNIVLIIVSLLGIFGNSLVLYIYAKHSAFHTKSFILLANLTMVDLLTCLTFGSLAAYRTVYLFQGIAPSAGSAFYRTVYLFQGIAPSAGSALNCILAVSPIRISVMVGVTNEFLVAIDRLVYMAKPMLHRCRLGKKYSAALVSLAWVRTVPYLVIWYWNYAKDPQAAIPICDLQDPYRSLDLSMELTDICFCGLTVLLYIGAIVAGRRTVYKSVSSMLCGGRNEMYLIPNMDNFMRRYQRAQHRIFRVVFIVTVLFVCTSLLAELLNAILAELYNPISI